jgi:hypothetical protein
LGDWKSFVLTVSKNKYVTFHCNNIEISNLKIDINININVDININIDININVIINTNIDINMNIDISINMNECMQVAY